MPTNTRDPRRQLSQTRSTRTARFNLDKSTACEKCGLVAILGPTSPRGRACPGHPRLRSPEGR